MEAEALADEARRAHAHEAEVVARRAAAWAARELYDHRAARTLLARARSVAARQGLDQRLGQVLVTCSAVHLELGDLRAAARDVEAARRAFAPDEPAELAFAEGLVAQKAGRVEQSVAGYRLAIRVAGPERDDVRFKAANNLGEVLTEAGRLDEADAALAEAAATADGFSLAFGAIAAVNRGWVAAQRGHLASAALHYARAEDLAERAGMPLVEFRLEQVEAYIAAGLWPEARSRLDALAHQLDAPGAALLRADAGLRLAEAALRCGDAEAAYRAATDAGARFARQRRPVGRASAVVAATEATRHTGAVDAHGYAAVRRAARLLDARGELERAVAAWLVVGRVAHACDRPAEARDAWDRAARLAATGPVLVRVQGQVARALAATSPAARLRACRTGLSELDGHRHGLASTELRARLAAQGVELADLGLNALPERCAPRRLLEWVEVGRSAGEVATAPDVPDAALADDLAALRRASRPSVDAGQAEGDPERRRLLRQRRLEDRVRRRAWTDASPVDSQRHLDIGAVIDRLGDTTLVSYGVVSPRLVAVSVTKGRAHRHDLGPTAGPLADARRLAFGARRLTATGDGAEVAGRATLDTLARLDAALLAPLAGRLGDAEVVVVPTPALAALPWGSLASLTERPVRVAPSVRAWHHTAAPGPSSFSATARTLLVAGPGLPGAAQEVRAVATRRPGSRVLLADDATADAVTVGLDGVSLAHLACHGSARLDAPLFSALELADGPFTVYDFERVPRLPQMVVLAACDAGLVGGAADGGEPLGFLTALLQRGARVVVAATVPIPDLDTSTLAVDFHDELLGGATAAAALWRARRRVDTTSPTGLATALAFSCFGGG